MDGCMMKESEDEFVTDFYTVQAIVYTAQVCSLKTTTA
jgi:hypothetical protein